MQWDPILDDDVDSLESFNGLEFISAFDDWLESVKESNARDNGEAGGEPAATGVPALPLPLPEPHHNGDDVATIGTHIGHNVCGHGASSAQHGGAWSTPLEYAPLSQLQLTPPEIHQLVGGRLPPEALAVWHNEVGHSAPWSESLSEPSAVPLSFSHHGLDGVAGPDAAPVLGAAYPPQGQDPATVATKRGKKRGLQEDDETSASGSGSGSSAGRHSSSPTQPSPAQPPAKRQKTATGGKTRQVGKDSCEECRRQKIRCIVQAGNSACDKCLAKGKPCNRTVVDGRTHAHTQAQINEMMAASRRRLAVLLSTIWRVGVNFQHFCYEYNPTNHSILQGLLASSDPAAIDSVCRTLAAAGSGFGTSLPSASDEWEALAAEGRVPWAPSHAACGYKDAEDGTGTTKLSVERSALATLHAAADELALRLRVVIQMITREPEMRAELGPFAEKAYKCLPKGPPRVFDEEQQTPLPPGQALIDWSADFLSRVSRPDWSFLSEGGPPDVLLGAAKARIFKTWLADDKTAATAATT